MWTGRGSAARLGSLRVTHVLLSVAYSPGHLKSFDYPNESEIVVWEGRVGRMKTRDEMRIVCRSTFQWFVDQIEFSRP
jgi:hypothetical protein